MRRRRNALHFFVALAEAGEQELRDAINWNGGRLQQEQTSAGRVEWALGAMARRRVGMNGRCVCREHCVGFGECAGIFMKGSGGSQSHSRKAGGHKAARAVALLGKGLLVTRWETSAQRACRQRKARRLPRVGRSGGLAEALTLVGFTLVWEGEASWPAAGGGTGHLPHSRDRWESSARTGWEAPWRTTPAIRRAGHAGSKRRDPGGVGENTSLPVY